MHDDLRALTVRWPWNSAIAYGSKRIENRSRPVPQGHLGTEICIHAGAGEDRAVVDGMLEWPHHRFEIIAVAVLADFHRDDKCCRPWGFSGAWHWELEDVRPVAHPVFVRGQLGLWRVPDDVREAVRRQICFATVD